MMMTVNNRFAALLADKGIKEKRRVTITEVAQTTGITRQTLQNWYTNTVTRFDAPVIDALCEFFGCEPGDLFEYVPKDQPAGGAVGDPGQGE